ncbi:kinase-like protein [Aspergillus steynii IBT 23096]|uniref:Serine/threonine-protein kinase ATG1 n=1 Tax=Aspergillus steynii IBT 23096 TaxID=1392250 RepID=A0A2I2G9W1_9EURO|nr:kinase-like protein [Aspergillus steynii IBT 23096]PLB49671.1 kinase-like protein [Aspergillus steynii IBT 23096]
MADGLGRARGNGSSNDSDASHTPGVSSPLFSPRPEQTSSSPQIQSPRIPDLVRDSKLETHFLPDSSVETVHTYHEPDYKSRRRLVPRLEHWTRHEKIGGGSFGSVWLEKCTKGAKRDNGLRAIKQMEVRRKSTLLNYNRELEAIAKFSHWKYERAFVKSFGWYESPEHLYIAMEYLELGDLHTYLHHKPPLPEHEAKEITFQILDGLFLMHDNEFAHRDMKPRNILLKSCPPDEWWVKIADFGISKRIEDEIGLSSTLKGTLGYIAPELHGFITRGSPYAPDIWSVGEIAFQMLTKQSTFKNLGVLFQYMGNLDLFPSDLLAAARVSKSGQGCILSLMHPDPSLRTTAEVALQHAWFEEAVPSRPGSIRSARNIRPASVTDAGTEELATWNTIATQESEGNSSNKIIDNEIGTWGTRVTHELQNILDPRQVEDLQIGLRSAPLPGEQEDPSTDKQDPIVSNPKIRWSTVSMASSLQVHRSTDDESDGDTASLVSPLGMTGPDDVQSDVDGDEMSQSQGSAGASNESVDSLAGNSREHSVGRTENPQYMNEGTVLSNRPYNTAEAFYESGAHTANQDNSFDPYRTWNEPRIAVPMSPAQDRNGSAQTVDGEPETFIAQRMKEIMDLRDLQGSITREISPGESANSQYSESPPRKLAACIIS